MKYERIKNILITTGYTQQHDKDEVLDYINEIQQENQSLKKENKILRENTEHNDKVVDKVNWENMLLKKENKQLKEINEEHKKLNGELREENKKYKEIIDKAIEYINKYESIKAYYEYIDEDGYDEYNYDEDFKKELLDILKEVE